MFLTLPDSGYNASNQAAWLARQFRRFVSSPFPLRKGTDVRYLIGFVFLFPIISLGNQSSAQTNSETVRPNVLFIMTDDHAANAVGAYGGRLASLDPTPTLDRLASEGVLLRNAFCTNSICTPSRATLLTGQYSHVNGIRTLHGTLEGDRQHLARLMGDAGYETAMVGKWHLTAEPAAFDFYQVLRSQGNYFNPMFLTRGPEPFPQNKRYMNGGFDSIHSSDAITNISLNWLKNRKQTDKPFFLMHHFKSPHDNFENAERFDWLYNDVEIPEPESLWERKNHGPIGRDCYGTSIGKRNTRRNMGDHMFVPKSLSESEYKRETYQRYLKKYLRCVRGVDENIQRLIDHLDATGELSNTVIVYTSDQGFMLGEHDYIDKRWMYEESLRVPFLVRFPEMEFAGSEVDAIVNNVDFAPTLLAMAGIEKPEFMQGDSFLPLLRGTPEPADWKQATYYRYWMNMTHHDNPAHYGIRTKTHKLIYFYGQPLDAEGALDQPVEPYWELYDLTTDPYEMNNIAEDPQHRGTLERLQQQLAELQVSVGDRPVEQN